MADKDLTVEEILLRCRQLDGEGGSAPEAEAPVEVPAEEVVAEPASAPAPIDPSGMSVADMLAAARASASGEEDASVEVAAEPAPLVPSFFVPCRVGIRAFFGLCFY